MYIKKFKELTYKNVDIAGGKGASLGEMAQYKFPIPPGFVVLAGAFDRFLEETDLGVEIEAVLKKVKMKDIHSVEDASETIRDMILDTKFPKDIGEIIKKEFKILGAKTVAVRSSATAEDSSVASWAGELESYLNVNDKGLLDAVKKCWSSLFTPRAIFYRYEKKLHDKKVSVAVVVQKMIQSEISGICFTAHPVTNDRNQIVIEAGYGLGEAIVGGKITPDTYIINKSEIRNPKFETNFRPRRTSLGLAKSKILNSKRNPIIDKNISEQRMMIVYSKNGTKETIVSKAKQEKQKISDSQILKIAEICQNVEKHYKKPQDIEWAIAKGRIYITQSRPITTL